MKNVIIYGMAASNAFIAAEMAGPAFCNIVFAL